MKKFYLSILISIFIISPFKTVEGEVVVTCGNGAFSEYTPFTSIPTYDYGPDGLVRFHISLNPDGWLPMPYFYSTYFRLTHYSANCENIRWDQKEGGIAVGISHLLVKAIETSPGWYSFETYNEDTGEQLAGPDSFPPPFSEPIVEFSTYWPHGASNIYGYFERGVWTPIVPVKDPNFVVTKTPVLIVPGILGSELYNGNELMWADLSRMFTDINDNFMRDNLGLDEQGNSVKDIELGGVIENMAQSPFEVNVFKNLKDLLLTKDYINNQNLFFFPYDWRLDIMQTKELLKNKIEVIKLQTGSNKVDIVAHSMGGLLVKNYLNAYGNSSVDKLIFVGTPHLGAPKAGKILLTGDNFGIPWLDNDSMRILAQNSPAVHELLPSPTYFSIYQGYIKPYKFLSLAPFWDYASTKDYISSKVPSQTFTTADSFFSQNLQDVDLSGIKTYNIAGCKTATEAGYNLTFGNRAIGQIGYTSGDSTVPLPSADYINAPSQNKYYVKNGNHSELPSAEGVRELIADILNGSETLYENISHSKDFCKFKGKTFVWHSPVEVHVYTQDGKHTGPIENNAIEYGIPGVNYEIIGHEKFIFLPTDEGQIYNIQAVGSDSGSFDLQISNIDDGNVLDATIYNDVPVEIGTPISFDVSDASLDNQILVNSETQNSSAELTGQQAEDLEPPQTIATINGTIGTGGWYKSSTQIILTATDTLSGLLETKYTVDGVAWKNYNEPLTINEEGYHKIEYYSIDRAGNNENIQTLEIQIDKTVPEFNLQFDIIAKGFEILATDNMDTEPAKVCTATKCTATDQAGNISVLNYQKLSLPFNVKNLILKNISYNGEIKVFDSNLFVVSYTLNKNNIANLTQTELIKNRQIMSAVYNYKKNQSIITDLTKGTKPQITTVQGLKFLQVSTNMGILKTIIK